jgi:Protein of unknown function (DUF1479).
MNTTFTSEQQPDDFKQHVRLMKQALRAQIGDVEGLFEQVRSKIVSEIAAARAEEKQHGTAWPQVSFADLAAGRISEQTKDHIRRRGCVVVKQTFSREQALAWDADMLNYLDDNDFDRVYQGPGDNFFGNLDASRPEIYPHLLERCADVGPPERGHGANPGVPQSPVEIRIRRYALV